MKILLITTGGTIVSKKDAKRAGAGLIPSDEINTLFSKTHKLNHSAKIAICPIFLKDSTNINPNDWILIIKKIYENKNLFDGFIITHGTDTMAYTASILSYTLGNLLKPVILTGAMIPASYPDTDANYNLENSIKFMSVLIGKGQSGVSICFNGKLMHGTRVRKINSQSADAFISVSYNDIGNINNGKAEINIIPFIDKTGLDDFSYNSIDEIRFEKNIFPIKLFPGFSSDYLNKIIDIKPSAIIIESFGTGGLPYLGENLLPLVEKAVLSDIIVVISTQCFKGVVDLSIYEVGQKAMKAGAISTHDMIYEAAVTKLMWLMPMVPIQKVKEYFLHNYCDEIIKNLI
ncbi:MAG: asparaginase [Spirochaetaceae bacterium]|nr:asparaginase [Spirochaetaceae bacterium]